MLPFALAGCASPPADANRWAEPVAWTPYALYAAPAPHPSLYVEVDAVEGIEPSEETLAALREFLETYCAKPGGVRIRRSTRIPRDEARGYYRHELALWHLNGPPTNSVGPAPAFMYLLFYDSTLEPRPRPAFVPRCAAALPAAGNWRYYAAHVDYLPYPAAAYVSGRVRGGEVDRAILLHEVGHLLGPRPGPKYHCESDDCVFYPTLTLRLRSIFLGRNWVYNRTVCDTCRAGLLAAKMNPAPDRLRFRGPWLTRQEGDYMVWTLPMLALLLPHVPEDADSTDFLQTLKAMALQQRTQWKTNRELVTVGASFFDKDAPAKSEAALESAREDWYDIIRERARKHLQERREATPASGR